MISELNCQMFAEKKIACLVMFNKIHYHLVTITMPVLLDRM